MVSFYSIYASRRFKYHNFLKCRASLIYYSCNVTRKKENNNSFLNKDFIGQLFYVLKIFKASKQQNFISVVWIGRANSVKHLKRNNSNFLLQEMKNLIFSKYKKLSVVLISSDCFKSSGLIAQSTQIIITSVRLPVNTSGSGLKSTIQQWHSFKY